MIATDRGASLRLFYSPLSFLRGFEDSLADHVSESLDETSPAGTLHIIGDDVRCFVRHLEWDSHYFGVPVYRIESVSWDAHDTVPAVEVAGSISSAVNRLTIDEPVFYVFAELPAEDNAVMQACGDAGFRLIETRLTYFTTHPGDAVSPDRSPSRLAGRQDIESLRDVAAIASNPYDRYHADRFFGSDVADAYLGTYAANSVSGLADAVLVPDLEDGLGPGAFATATITRPPRCPLGLTHPCPLTFSFGMIRLVAVAPYRKGWHVRLLSEMNRYLSEAGVDVVAMTTQAANRAVIRNCEKLGMSLGRTTHILAISRGSLASATTEGRP